MANIIIKEETVNIDGGKTGYSYVSLKNPEDLMNVGKDTFEFIKQQKFGFVRKLWG